MRGVGVFSPVNVSPLLIFLVALPVWAETPISLYYYERPPYMVAKPDGSAHGITADVAAKAFALAHVPYTWNLMPAKRQLMTVERNEGRDCTIGWFKNPQRAAYGQFTHPIYRDKPPVVIARHGFEPQTDSLAQLMKRDDLRILVKEGLTYGSYINDLLGTTRAKVSAFTVEQPQLVRMVAAGRADIMFAPREEAEFFVTGHESGTESVQVLTFGDIPAGEPRYLFCSRQVDSATMAKLNAAIDRIKP